MTRKTLAELFAASPGVPIKFGRLEVHPIYVKAVTSPTSLRIRFVAANPAVRQAVRVSVTGGSLRVDGEVGTDFVLWADTAPRVVNLQVDPTRPRATVKFWNAWEAEDGTMDAWLRDCGMVIESGKRGVTLRCSDGVGAPDFDDLVLEIEET